MNQTSTQALSEFVVNLKLKDIPHQVQENARRSFIDTLACILIGSREDGGRLISRYGRSNISKHGSSVLGAEGYRTSPSDAALVNGTLAHALDYDDTYSTIEYASVGRDSGEDGEPEGMSVGHMGSCLLPAVLAAGEHTGASGVQALEAYVAGFEVACRLGHAMGFQHYSKGYHSTSTLGCIGAAAASAKLLGLSAEDTCTAFAIASSQAGGLRANFGTMAKPLQAGNGARSGVFAAFLAKTGFTACKDVFGDELGYLSVLSLGGGKGPEAIMELPDGGFHLLRGNSLKFLPCANALQSSLETMIDLSKEHDLRAENVSEIQQTVLMPRYRVCTKDGVSYNMPSKGLEGKFILPFGLAAALIDRKISLSTFTDEYVQRADLRELFQRTNLVLDSKCGVESLKVRMQDGRVLSAQIGASKGHWSSMFPEDMLRDKFLDCATEVMPEQQAAELFGLANDLETLSNVGEMIDLARMD